MVGMERFELSASCSQSRRANQAALHPGYSCASLLIDPPIAHQLLQSEGARLGGRWQRPSSLAYLKPSRGKGVGKLINMKVATTVSAVDIRDHGDEIKVGAPEYSTVSNLNPCQHMRQFMRGCCVCELGLR